MKRKPLQLLATALSLTLGLLAWPCAHAQSVALAGRMGERALLVVDGKPHTLTPGQSAAGVKFERWAGETAELRSASGVVQLRVGGTPALLSGTSTRKAGREIVLTAGPGGHFVTMGAINGKPARFMVDTGATLLAMGQDEAQRLGLDLTSARKGMSQTANGPVQVHIVVLNHVRVGEVEVANVGAAVMPQSMPFMLLGNSFLNRFQMQRHNDEMRLQLK